MKKVYVYCHRCHQAYLTDYTHCPDLVAMDNLYQGNQSSCANGRHGDSLILEFAGVELVEGFVDEEEEKSLHEQIEQTPWTDSQSGRRKQVHVQCSRSKFTGSHLEIIYK